MTTSHHFLTQAVRRGYVTPNPVFLSLPPSGGVASLLSSQSHIPFALLFRFQGAMKRSFTYSHWEQPNAHPKREKYFEFEKSSHLFGIEKPKRTLFSEKIFKNFFGMFGRQKKKAYGVTHTLPNRHIAGAIFAFFLPCKAFSKGGQGKDTFLPVSPKCAFQGIKTC